HSALEGDVEPGRRGGADDFATAVFDPWKPIGHGAGAWPIAAGRDVHSESLMGPFQVVHAAPKIEGSLHLRQIAEAPHVEYFVLQRAVEALVLAACLRVAWPGMHHPDAKLEQPNLKPGPVHARAVAPWLSVVRWHTPSGTPHNGSDRRPWSMDGSPSR